ncbi:MAG: protein BatD, partial [Calditrichaeota bacterium]
PNQKSRQSGNALDFFLKAIPSKRNLYVNEQVSVSYKVYFRVSVRNPEFVKLPETIGFWVEEFDLPKDIPITQEVINGVRYNVAELKKLALFPTKSGELRVTPMRLALDVVQRRRRDPFSMFDDFFDDPFGRTVRKVLTSNEVVFKVRPLPVNSQLSNFSGIVGSLTMQVNVDKLSVTVNDAISYKIKLTSSGNLKSLKKLNIDFPTTFEVFEPKTRQSISRAGNKLISVKEMEYVLIPRTTGTFQIPALKLVYFDPVSGKYRTLSSDAYEINVTPAEGVEGLTMNNYVPKSEVRLLGKDINFIKEEELHLQPRGYRVYNTPGYWITIFSATLILGIALAYRRYLDKMGTNVEYARKRKAYGIAKHRLKKAHQFLKKGELAEFYGEVSRSLIGFVADKTNTPSAGLLKDEVLKLLTDRNVEKNMVEEFGAILDEADLKRFAATQVTPEEAQQFYQKAEQLLTRLGKYF